MHANCSSKFCLGVARLVASVLMGATALAGMPAPPVSAAEPRSQEATAHSVDPETVEGLPAGAAIRDAGPDFREWLNPDGTVGREMFPGPVFFEKSAGVWVPIVLDLRAGPTGDFVPERAHAGAAVFTPAVTPAQPVIRLETPAAVSVRYPEAIVSDRLPSVEGSSVTYPGALVGGRDLVLSATTTGFEEAVRIPGPASPATYITEFTVRDGISARQVGPGIEFVNAAGDVVGRYMGGLAWDAAEQRAETSVLVTLRSAVPGKVVTETGVDPAWLTADRVYPVTVDPVYDSNDYMSDWCSSSATTESSCDTYTNSDNKNGNDGVGYWGHPELRLGSSGAFEEGSTTVRSDTRTYIKFRTDVLGTYPWQHNVTSATLQVYAWEAGNSPALRNYRVYELQSQHPTRYTVWDNQPGLPLSAQIAESSSSGTGYVSWNVTSTVDAWFEGVRPNLGFGIRAASLRDHPSFRQLRAWYSGYSQSPRLTANFSPNPPWPPENVNATAGNGYAAVSWTEPAYDGASDISGYLVQMRRATDGTLLQSDTVGSSSRSHSMSVGNGETVYFNVHAINSAGTSAASSSQAVSVGGPPGQPCCPSATAGDTVASVTWGEASANGTTVSGYTVRTVNAANGTVLATTSYPAEARAHTQTGLTNGTPVKFRITASNSYGTSSPVESSSVTPAGRPLTPTGVVATSGDAHASVSWEAAGANGSAVTGYIVETREGDNSLVDTATLPADARSRSVTGLVNDRPHFFRVRAVNALGNSDWAESNQVTPVAPPPIPPDEPTVPELRKPSAAYAFAPGENQRFAVMSTDAQNDRYQPQVELRADNGAPVNSTVGLPPADSGATSEGAIDVPLLEGRYRWRARSCDITPEPHCSQWSGWQSFQVAPLLRPSAGSSTVGLEQFYAYEHWNTGAGRAYVNAANGNLVIQETDLEVPGPINLRLTRTYNTLLDPQTGPLGRGWTLGIAEGEGMADALLEAVLSLDLDRMVRVIGNEDMFQIFDADGTTHRFSKGGIAGLGWHSPPGVDLTLTDGPDGPTHRWYHATRPDGIRYEFKFINSSYRLFRIADRKGNALTMTYSGPKLTQIADGSGRVLTLTWTGSHLARATYAGGGETHHVDYAVDDEERLTSVTQAAGTAAARGRTFGYGPEGLNAVTDARGNTTSFLISDGRVTAVTDRAGKPWAVNYNDQCAPAPGSGQSAMCVLPPGQSQGRTWTVDAAGNPVRLTDAGDLDESGNARRNSRNWGWNANRVVRSTDENGTFTAYAYNELGQIVEQRVTAVGETPLVTQMEYDDVGDGIGDLERVRVAPGLPEERVLSFAYDAEGRGLITRRTDARGKSTTYAYYANGMVKSITDPLARKTVFGDTAQPDGAYHFTGQPTSITDAAGATMTFAYDALGRVTERVDRTGQSWTQSWDARGNLVSSTDPLGNVTRYCYDLNNNRILHIRPKAPSPSCDQDGTDAHVSAVSYDVRDLPTFTDSTSDGQRRRTRTDYDDAGRPARILMPRSFDAATGDEVPPASLQLVTHELYPNGRLKAFIDPEGNRTEVVYTPSGLPWRVTMPPGENTTAAQRRTVTRTYNARGQELTVAETGQEGVTRHEYNILGERVATTNPRGQRTTYAYDKNGQTDAITDPRGRISDWVYNDGGELISVSQPADIAGVIQTRYTYTPRGEIASETDPADPKHLVTYEYDAEGRQIARRDVNDGIVTRVLQQVRRADGSVAERAASFSGTSTGAHRTVYDYDEHGSPVRIRTYLDGASDVNGSDIQLTYTTAGEAKQWSETLFPSVGAPITKSSSFAYERDGAMVSRDVDGHLTAYQHLRNGLETSTSAWSGLGTIGSSWNPDGSVRAQSLPNGVALDYTYDAAGRLSSKIASKAAVALSSWQQVVYDANGNRTGEIASQRQADGSMKTGNATYAYDVVDRLTQAKHPFETSSKSYVLDEGGNIVADGETNYTYAKNRLTKTELVGTPEDWPAELGPFPAGQIRTAFSYDQHGNMVRQETTQPGQPASVTTFTYDAAGHPRRTTSPDGTWVEYAYDGLDRMVRRHESTGATLLVFHDRSGAQPSLETDGAGTVKVRYILNSHGLPVGQEQSGAGAGWYVTDLRGNLTQLLDSEGAVKAVYAYDPFGRARSAHTQTMSGFDSRLRYQLAPMDSKTSTYNLGPRLYDPGINRFIGADLYASSVANMGLALDPLTGNRYLYAGANPAGLIDDGHGWCPFGRNPDGGCRGGRYWRSFWGTVDSVAGTIGAAFGFVYEKATSKILGKMAGKVMRRFRAWFEGDPFGPAFEFKSSVEPAMRKNVDYMVGGIVGAMAGAIAGIASDLLNGIREPLRLAGKAVVRAAVGFIAGAITVGICTWAAAQSLGIALAPCLIIAGGIIGSVVEAYGTDLSRRFGWGDL